MGRLAEHLLDRALLDDAAEVHDRDALAHLADHGQVVADEEVGEAVPGAQLGQEVQDLRLDRHVERRGRLVQHQQLGSERQGAGDAHPLLLPARQLVRVAVQEIARQADIGQQRRDPLAQRPTAGDAMHLQGLGDGGLHRQPRVEGGRRVLVDQLHPPPHRP
ncbi:hypothetical protein STVA_10190 [Allostella vacuolata]|nr:hypothetical protein STVA_10190 [Stella vacuolata]